MEIINFSEIKSLLLNNISTRQTIFKNTFWLAVAEGVTRFLKLILIIYVARILGATEYGKFTFALAFVSIFIIFSELGLSQITTRELSGEKEKEKEYPSLLSLKILLSLGTLFLILVSSFFITKSPSIQKIIWILAIYVLVSNFSEIIYAFLRARQQMEYESWTKIFQAFIITAAGFLAIRKFYSVEGLSYAYLFSSLLALIFILIFFHFKVYPLSLNWQKSIWKKFLSLSWPLALAGIFSTIYSQTDSIVMGYLGQITQTGWYNAAYKIVGVTLIPSTLISQSFFPALSLAFKESKEKLQKIWNYFLESMIFLAIPIVVGGIALAPKIIDFIYDPSYFPSILAFRILILMAGISFIATPFHNILIIFNQQKKLFWVTFLGAAIDVILNLLLVPKYSLYGAAITSVFNILLVSFLLFNFTLKFTKIQSFNLKSLFSFIGAALSSSAMYFLISQPQIYSLNVLLTVLIGAGIYSLSFFAFQAVTKNLCKS
jgi:O-antigen/teichoic acid export membrane protein